MKRWIVIAAVSAATFAGTLAGIALAFDVRPDMYGEAILLLRAKAAKECADGCAIVSPREMHMIEEYVRADERAKRAKGTAL